MGLTREQETILLRRFPPLTTYCYNEHFKLNAPIRAKETYDMSFRNHSRFYNAVKAITYLGIGMEEVILDQRIKPALEDRASALGISVEEFRSQIRTR